jgi:hypothetical protein
MARNFSFLKSKKFWIGILVFVALGILLYLFLHKSGAIKDSLSGGLREDTDPPTVIIESPEQATWEGRSFVVQVFEEDLESGLQKDSCTYQVCGYDKTGEERCSGIMSRACNSAIQEITVGQGMLCSFEGRDACIVFAQAQDRAGNKGETYSAFHIDFTPPSIQESVLRESVEGYAVQGQIYDENAIARCALYENGRYMQDMEFMGDCTEKENCKVATTFKPEQLEPSALFIRCSDAVGNTADGETLLLVVNQPPVVEFCRVNPAQGKARTEFRFSASATDPDPEILSYRWDFGDGSVGDGKEPVHAYLKPGVYTPRVTALDSGGLSAECDTAWVVVE